MADQHHSSLYTSRTSNTAFRGTCRFYPLEDITSTVDCLYGNAVVTE